MANTIRVKGAKKDNRVVLWEKDAAHPNGEVMVANDGATHEVGETAAVKRLIAEGALVTTAPTSKAQPKGGEPKPPASPLAGLGLTAEQERALVEAGYADRAALAAASDDDLVAVPTIGKATVENMRKALAP